MAIITLAGEEYEIPARFNIGELKRMAEIVDGNANVVERSRQLITIALSRKHPEVVVDDNFETDFAEVNAAAATVINIAGFMMVGKQKAVPAAA